MQLEGLTSEVCLNLNSWYSSWVNLEMSNIYKTPKTG